MVPETVPADGAVVLVRSARAKLRGQQELRTVYDEDVTNVVGADLADAGSRAALAIDSEFCGVDVITTDPGVSLEVSGGVVDEINTTPGLHHHYGLPVIGGGSPPSDDLAGQVLRYAAGVGAASHRRV